MNIEHESFCPAMAINIKNRFFFSYFRLIIYKFCCPQCGFIYTREMYTENIILVEQISFNHNFQNVRLVLWRVVHHHSPVVILYILINWNARAHLKFHHHPCILESFNNKLNTNKFYVFMLHIGKNMLKSYNQTMTTLFGCGIKYVESWQFHLMQDLFV